MVQVSKDTWERDVSERTKALSQLTRDLNHTAAGVLRTAYGSRLCNLGLGKPFNRVYNLASSLWSITVFEARIGTYGQWQAQQFLQ